MHNTRGKLLQQFGCFLHKCIEQSDLFKFLNIRDKSGNIEK